MKKMFIVLLAHSSALLLVLLLIAESTVADNDGTALKPGYFMCKEFPLQLRWFTRFTSSSDFMDAGASNTLPLSAATPQARRALEEGWCANTDGMEYFSVERIVPCDDEWNNIPHGGCIRVTVSPEGSAFQSTWYTFRNAVKR